MYTVKLQNVPDKLWVSEVRSCIDLHAVRDYILNPNQVGFIDFGEFRYEFHEEVLGLPFTKRKDLKLYYPKGFKLSGTGAINLPIDNRGRDTLHISKGEYLATLRLMTTQFYSLVCRKDGSDKGLRSAYIKIDLL